MNGPKQSSKGNEILLESSFVNLERQLTFTRELFVEKVKSLEEENVGLKKRVKELEDENEGLSKDKVDLVKNMEDHEKKVEEYRGRIIRLKRQRKSLQNLQEKVAEIEAKTQQSDPIHTPPPTSEEEEEEEDEGENMRELRNRAKTHPSPEMRTSQIPLMGVSSNLPTLLPSSPPDTPPRPQTNNKQSLTTSKKNVKRLREGGEGGKVQKKGRRRSTGTINQKKSEEDEPGYAYNEVVRKKSERAKLKGFSCVNCEKYYASLERSGIILDKEEMIQQCSRHRAKFEPTSTPPGFWELGFPDEEETPRKDLWSSNMEISKENDSSFQEL